MGTNFGIERMNEVRDAENNHRDYGTTGLSENLDRDDGIEDPFVEPWFPCTANIVPFSAVNVLEYVKVRKSWGPTYYTPPPAPSPHYCTWWSPWLIKVREEKRKTGNKAILTQLLL